MLCMYIYGNWSFCMDEIQQCWESKQVVSSSNGKLKHSTDQQSWKWLSIAMYRQGWRAGVNLDVCCQFGLVEPVLVIWQRLHGAGFYWWFCCTLSNFIFGMWENVDGVCLRRVLSLGSSKGQRAEKPQQINSDLDRGNLTYKMKFTIIQTTSLSSSHHLLTSLCPLECSTFALSRRGVINKH